MKRNKHIAEICALLALSLGLASCAKTPLAPSETTPQKSIATVPASWILPETRLQAGETITQATTLEAGEDNAEAALAPDVDRLFSVSRAAVEKASQGVQDADARSSSHPADWVPWHMEFFTTDLSVTASGKIGVLSVVGNPWVQAFWRRQNEPTPQSAKPQPPAAIGDSTPAASLMISDASSSDEVSRQLETIVRTTMATGQVNDESKLRENLGNFSAQFQALVKALEAADQNAPGAPGSEWWVSRLRVDLIVAASGTIGVAPATLGGNLRLRFEWQRLSPSSRVPALANSRVTAPPAPEVASVPAGPGSMKDFVLGMKTDLATAAADAYQESGLYPYQVEVGLGMTASGMVGVAKGSAELLGHVYFGTNVTKPVVHPPGKATPGWMLLIENAPDASHLALADQSGISHLPTPDGVVYQIAHEKFAAGLKKAIHMGAFFAKRAAQPTKSVWKPYQMYVGFDVSVTGTTGLISLAGNSSDEIDFYNRNF